MESPVNEDVGVFTNDIVYVGEILCDDDRTPRQVPRLRPSSRCVGWNSASVRQRGFRGGRMGAKRRLGLGPRPWEVIFSPIGRVAETPQPMRPSGISGGAYPNYRRWPVGRVTAGLRRFILHRKNGRAISADFGPHEAGGSIPKWDVGPNMVTPGPTSVLLHLQSRRGRFSTRLAPHVPLHVRSRPPPPLSFATHSAGSNSKSSAPSELFISITPFEGVGRVVATSTFGELFPDLTLLDLTRRTLILLFHRTNIDDVSHGKRVECHCCRHGIYSRDKLGPTRADHSPVLQIYRMVCATRPSS